MPRGNRMSEDDEIVHMPDASVDAIIFAALNQLMRETRWAASETVFEAKQSCDRYFEKYLEDHL